MSNILKVLLTFQYGKFLPDKFVRELDRLRRKCTIFFGTKEFICKQLVRQAKKALLEKSFDRCNDDASERQIPLYFFECYAYHVMVTRIGPIGRWFDILRYF